MQPSPFSLSLFLPLNLFFLLYFFFFFQAEDGIRDKLVTGVQTCALPISPTDTIPSSTATLTAGTTGYGLCAGDGGSDSGRDATTPTGAVPTRVAPWNGACSTASHAVGGLTTSPQTVWSISTPSQNAFFRLFVKAAIAPSVPAHTDYADTLTFVATGTY